MFFCIYFCTYFKMRRLISLKIILLCMTLKDNVMASQMLNIPKTALNINLEELTLPYYSHMEELTPSEVWYGRMKGTFGLAPWQKIQQQFPREGKMSSRYNILSKLPSTG